MGTRSEGMFAPGVLISTALLLAAGCARSGPVPEVLVLLPDFTMRAIAPKTEPPFGRKEMLGSVWVVDFIFTRCHGPCPVLSRGMQALSRSLPPEVRLMTVTIDPEGDTPAVLRAYAAALGARYPRWVFLRGTREQTRHLVYAGFRQHLGDGGEARPPDNLTHSTRFVLVDRTGGVRGYYDGLGGEEDAAALARDARRLARAGL